MAYNSCRHRSCPQCAWLPREQWLSPWKQRLLVCHSKRSVLNPHSGCATSLPFQTQREIEHFYCGLRRDDRI
ncbi:MAG: transposase zinc-binding domain-containing protein [Planctomycetota bacterium]|nr:transposase zinc-binding domain-containing protein [Planctomycetota bacterium]